MLPKEQVHTSDAEYNPKAHSGAIRVLLAEDDGEFRAMLSSALRSKGYLVTECANGLELAQQVARSALPGGDQKCDLVISDVRMPGMFGLSVLEALHQLEDALPVILITAFGDDETHAYAERLGAAAMFDKPFPIGELLSKVDEIFDFS